MNEYGRDDEIGWVGFVVIIGLFIAALGVILWMFLI